MDKNVPGVAVSIVSADSEVTTGNPKTRRERLLLPESMARRSHRFGERYLAAGVEVALKEEAGRELWKRFTVHYTPKHGSWLNPAEIEASLWSR
ncbi:hypothetical protein [Nannocystis sp. SCPEA4]|uniref:hypothetical protein n=1 Tax=Nannocystis sp. SCPEA4 TaxID=2996787 RepID=UPI002271C2BC|nr:hypothetical protein [Nannocystis sp. SCPEA4]MCY1059586.1 hypothetical protein [Nannocystis sp. SCPEA4]